MPDGLGAQRAQRDHPHGAHDGEVLVLGQVGDDVFQVPLGDDQRLAG
ncbi:hypothetical protein [Kitasatospora sp. MY 5-36]|nr:hypothetical protein [Kitasatospora sp. MY 5-36]